MAAKKVFPAAIRRLGANKTLSTSRSCQLYGVSRQGLYQRRQRPARQAEREAAVVEQVQAVRTKLPAPGNAQAAP